MINEIIASRKKTRPGQETASYSTFTLAEINSIYDPITSIYVQPEKSIPEEDFQLLTQFLSRTSTCIEGSRIADKEAKLLYFISPILVVVCSLFKGDVQIKVEQNLNGNNIKATCRCEFMLQKGGKRICIIEAKKDDMSQGLAQCLIGCEVVSDVDKIDVVYGIVTTFSGWLFLKSCDGRIEYENTTIEIIDGKPNPDGVRRIAGKIYALLSDTPTDPVEVGNE